MRTMIWGVAVAVVGCWAIPTLAAAEEEKAGATEKDTARWVTQDGQVIVLDGAGEGTIQVRVNATAEADGAGAASRAVVLRRTGDGGAVDTNAGWLGVQFGSTETTDDLTESTGVVVLNVIEDSPAQAAGFAAGDVVIEVNDVAIGEDLETFVHTIRDSGAGTRVKFTVLRDGERRTLVSTLGSRAEHGPMRWMFKSMPNSIMKDDVHRKIHMLVPGEDHEWVMEQIEDLEDLPELSAHILSLLPESKNKTVEVIANDGGTTITTTVRRDGESVSVSRTDDGEIAVTRGEGSDAAVTLFADEVALEMGDAEAYEIYKDASGHVVIDLKGDGLSYSFGTDVDLDGLHEHLGGLHEHLGDLHEHLKGALGDVDFSFDGDVDVEELHNRLTKLHGLGADAKGFVFRTGKVKRTIHENADGSIEVTTRKGDSELVQHYVDSDDLAERSPDDYQAYQELHSDEGTR